MAAMLFAIVGVVTLLIAFSSGDEGAGFLVLAILFLMMAAIALWGTISLAGAGRI